MKKLFVSYQGEMSGKPAKGWLVLNHEAPLNDGTAVENLCSWIESERGYDAGTLILINFQRLEDGLEQGPNT